MKVHGNQAEWQANALALVAAHAATAALALLRSGTDEARGLGAAFSFGLRAVFSSGLRAVISSSLWPEGLTRSFTLHLPFSKRSLRNGKRYPSISNKANQHEQEALIRKQPPRIS